MRFEFHLIPLNEVPAWGENPQTLSWYGLTDGLFWIEVDAQELFRYTQALEDSLTTAHPEYQPKTLYEDYQVARYWEDLQEIIRYVLDPLPEDFAARVASAAEWQLWQARVDRWVKQDATEEAWNLRETALHWWWQRTWDSSHLTYSPRLWLWTVGGTTHLLWDNRGILHEGIPVWEAQFGEITLPVSEFIEAVRSFDTRLIAAMQERVNEIKQSWSRPEVKINLTQLEEEQIERATWMENALTFKRRDFTWDETRDAIATIEQRSGE